MYQILLVEDEKRMQEIIADYFKVKECQVICASNGIKALELIKEGQFDLVLLDIMMPGLDGFTVCREIRKTMDIPIIFVTAKSDEADNLYGYTIGADDYVTKPFSLNVLYAKSIALIKRAKGIIVEEKLKVNDICVNCRTYEVTVRSCSIRTYAV